MGSSLKNKLKSHKGASMMVAMLFFFVAMFVGSVCLAVAYTNAGRLKGTVSERQQYYDVLSAIDVITNEVKNTTVRKTGDFIDVEGESKILADYFNFASKDFSIEPSGTSGHRVDITIIESQEEDPRHPCNLELRLSSSEGKSKATIKLQSFTDVEDEEVVSPITWGEPQISWGNW